MTIYPSIYIGPKDGNGIGSIIFTPIGLGFFSANPFTLTIADLEEYIAKHRELYPSKEIEGEK